MHDYHAAKTLVEGLLGELSDVERVTQVRIHAAVTYSPDALQQAYEMLTNDTPLEGSRLVIDERPNAYECPSCRGHWTLTRDDVAGHLILCPFCGAPSSFEGSSRIEVAEVTTASG